VIVKLADDVDGINALVTLDEGDGHSPEIMSARLLTYKVEGV
jgi:hypothetical protein